MLGLASSFVRRVCALELSPFWAEREGTFLFFGGEDDRVFAVSRGSRVSRVKMLRRVLSGPIAGADWGGKSVRELKALDGGQLFRGPRSNRSGSAGTVWV